METPEFPKADREEVFRLLATDYRDGSMGCDEFKVLYQDRPGLRVLFIRSGRMDPYEHVRSLLPEDSTLDVFAPAGVLVTDPNVDSVFHYPAPGLMRMSGLGRLKSQFKKSYDLAIYLNTFQNGMSFENIVRIARHSGRKVYEYQAGKQLREIKPEGYATTKLYSKKEGSAHVRVSA